MRFPLKDAVFLLSTILPVLAVVSCGESAEPRPITEVRTVDAPRKPADPAATTAQRFGLEPMAQDAGTPVSPEAIPSSAPDAVTPESPGFTWAVPAGWQEGEATAFSQARFVLGETLATECSVSVFPDAAGGIEENMARWYRQFGQDPPASINDLPTVEVLGQPCPLAEIAGDFAGMMGAARPGYAMLGVICERPGGSVFVKMVGPVEEVRVSKQAFLAFCASLKAEDQP